MTPTSLLDVRLGISSTKAGKEPPGVGGPTMLDLYGITGIPTDPRFAGGLTEQGVTGWTTWGRQNSNPQFQDPSVFNPSTTRGFAAARASRPATSTRRSTRRSTTSIRSTARHLRRAVQPSVDGGGRPGDLQPRRLHVRPAQQLRDHQPVHRQPPAADALRYLQDDFRATDRLTLNLGLRYEFATPQWEKDNFLTNFDPETNTLIQAKDGSIYDRALVNPDRNNFAPRLGLAYSIDSKTVLRSGYGVSYIHFNRLGGENLLSFNGPHVVALNITQQPSQGLCAATRRRRPASGRRSRAIRGLNVPANFS